MGSQANRAAQAMQWRIDDLAREASVTVDTIRFYAREGLLPRPARAGRHKLYGPRHLDRLHRIRELQDRRFSLAAIKAILDAEAPGVEGIFTGGERCYTLDELAALSGLDDDLIGALRRIGVLPDPQDIGRDAYDATDLAMLEAAAELVDLGMPEEVLVELGRIYVTRFRELQQDVADLFAGVGAVPMEPEQVDRLQRRLTAESGRLIPAAGRVLHYLHLRTLQRITLERLRATAQERRLAAAIEAPSETTPAGPSLD